MGGGKFSVMPVTRKASGGWLLGSPYRGGCGRRGDGSLAEDFWGGSLNILGAVFEPFV